MPSDRKHVPAVDRRTVLKGLASTGALAAGGLTAGSVSGDPEDEVQIPVGTYEPDTSHLPEVDSARVEINEDGSVSKHLSVNGKRLARSRGRGGNAGGPRKVANYSIGLELDSNGRKGAKALAKGRPDDAGLRAAVDKRERKLGAKPVDTLTHNEGIDETPDSGSRDYAAYGHAASQECGPLARTSVLSDVFNYYGMHFYNTSAERESADGEACAGHEWDAKFEPFCDFLRFAGLSCSVPSAFNTRWRAPGKERRDSTAGTVYTCGNFPAVPDTVVSAQRVEMTEGSSTPGVDFDVNVGVVPINDFRDYDLDWNGITNLAVDGLSTLFPGVRSVYSYALATWLLKHDSGVVV